MVVWNLLKGLQLVADNDQVALFTKVRMTEEALFGADFLVRMQDKQGFFYMTVFDKWSKDINQREICAYETQQGYKSDDYQAGFRQGGGASIAALAAAARLEESGEYTSDEYLTAAEKGYWHLREFNTQYLNDQQENIIDEYCALLAAVELYKSTNKQQYLTESRYWAARLEQRQTSDDSFEYFWSANQDGSRPYYHASRHRLLLYVIIGRLKLTDKKRRQLRLCAAKRWF